MWTPQEENERRERQRLQEAKWRSIYDANPEVKQLAEKIHNNRMLPPPACAQCIEIAVRRLEKQGYKIL